MKKMIKEISDYVLSIFFPNRCIFCDELTQSGEDMCVQCEDELPWIDGEICQLCGVEKSKCVCKGRHGQYYDGIAAPLYYEGNAKRCIHSFKFRDNKDYYRQLSTLMTDTFKKRFDSVKIDYVTYIPMTAKSTKKRGYNQSRLLAKQIAENLGIEFADNLLIKLYETKSQHDCKSIVRKGNLLGVFDVNESYNIDGKNILIVDDVKTSGSTLSESGKMLYLYGVNQVFCLTAALVNSTIERQNN